MKKRNLVVGVLGCLAILGSVSSFAGNRPGAFTLSLGDGYYRFATKRHLDNSSIPNAAVAYNINDRWAAEAGWGVLNSENNLDQYVHGNLYTLNGLYRFEKCKYFEPYALAGVGILGLKPAGVESVNQGLVDAGIGTQFFADKSIALRADVRDIYVLSGGKNDIMVNFGLSFLFGGEDSKPVAAFKS